MLIAADNPPCGCEPGFALLWSLFISAECLQPLVVQGTLPNHLSQAVSSVLAAAAKLMRASVPLGHGVSAPDP